MKCVYSKTSAIVVLILCLDSVGSGKDSSERQDTASAFVEARAVQMQSARLEEDNRKLKEQVGKLQEDLTKCREQEASLEREKNALAAQLGQKTRQASELSANLDSVNRTLNEFKHSRIGIRIETFNGHSYDKELGTVEQILPMHDSSVIDNDMTHHPGFDDDKGIPRRLKLRRY